MQRLRLILNVARRSSRVLTGALVGATVVSALVWSVACGHDPVVAMPDMLPRVDPFMAVPPCDPSLLTTPLTGTQLLLSSLKIGSRADGFDLDGDGHPDNLLAPLGALANPSIAQTFMTDRSVILPIELFGYKKGADSACTKVSFYIGRVNEDKDGDGADTSWNAGKADCDDTDPTIHPGVADDVGKTCMADGDCRSKKCTAGKCVGARVDTDCDGFADNPTNGVAPTDTTDLDGDGYSLAMGDCDDRADVPSAKNRHPGAMEICDNGIDEDCDGVADNGPGCTPFGDNKSSVHALALGFRDPGSDGGTLNIPDGGMVPMASTLEPVIVFPDGNVKSSVLNAGPDLFGLSIPFDKNSSLNLTLSAVHLQLDIAEKPAGTYVTSGKLGGVLESVTMGQITNINAGGVIKKDQSLLDALFVGPLGAILGLTTDAAGHQLPDMDVDGDGLETFWQENTMATDGGTPDAIIDTCRDGDGTIIHSNFDGKGTGCWMAIDPKTNKYRFVDGVSVALTFTAVPVVIKDIVPK